jgi:hypothetical protein
VRPVLLDALDVHMSSVLFVLLPGERIDHTRTGNNDEESSDGNANSALHGHGQRS